MSAKRQAVQSSAKRETQLRAPPYQVPGEQEMIPARGSKQYFYEFKRGCMG